MSEKPDSPRPPAAASQRRLWIASGLLVIVTAGLTFWWQERPERRVSKNGAGEMTAQTARQTSSSPPQELPGKTAVAENVSEKSQEKSPIPAGPATTRARQRDAVVTPFGVRKSVVDLMASWTDLPPWPEGPRLYAEVETTSKKYINLRPDDYGALPRILTNPGERLEIKITIPDAEPGEKIHVELPNGGAFSDSKVVGRIYDVQEGHSLTFSVFADEARGNCNVKMRHRGHTRSIPIWVGEPEETGS